MPIRSRRREAVFAAFADARNIRSLAFRSRIFSRTQLGSTPPRRRDEAASAGELGPDSRRHPIIHAKGLPYC